ncbi:Peptidoglycan deacetylase [Fusarium euwallaceae]|uniref:Peptidoglycan deacetylase n=5 Tax=Fusarium solani species complex TaxID=232080 RepID=A0A3M2RWR8_9HYPO|nr:Peptidoglycan deacetylase [Fusarium kuroshium]RSL83003.1 Peptidoglycan deacetylase [Fusarium floridanum]RSM00067.1 Peptidoglycan deacetylase [Fusarium ambrosium]RSM08907.1 Peptidoglycan deacetylase [Fusarium oligoseptatum]RTE80510.1 Peptidoglycan deacetylase [Fusarium euwallaceae]
MGKKKVMVCYGVDIDAVAGWLGSYGGEDSTSDVSRGIWAGTIGTRRLLKLFDKYNIKASWFIPGHTLESFPEECALVRDAGHEIGVCSVPLRQLTSTNIYSFMDIPMRILQT